MQKLKITMTDVNIQEITHLNHELFSCFIDRLKMTRQNNYIQYNTAYIEIIFS